MQLVACCLPEEGESSGYRTVYLNEQRIDIQRNYNDADDDCCNDVPPAGFVGRRKLMGSGFPLKHALKIISFSKKLKCP